jgi:ribonuclease G
VFDCFGVQAQIDAAFHRQVWLPCGGYIVIDETEALIAVDVNTGRNKGAKDIEKTILQTNLEAADEICRQMRLRNVGGIIIADFIDMKSRKDQQTVYQRVRDRLARQGLHARAAYLAARADGNDGSASPSPPARSRPVRIATRESSRVP